MRRYLGLIFFYSFIYTTSLCGQSTNYQIFDNISLGADATSIGCFLQDSDGLIWIGSDKGLFSYDGYSVQPHFDFGKPENARIHCGLSVDDKYLYLGSDGGIHIYNYHTDQYENTGITFPGDVRSMVLDGELLWIGSLNGLYTYHIRTQEIVSFPVNENPGLTHPSVYSLLRASDGNIYIGTYDGFCKYDYRKEMFERIELPSGRSRNNQFVNALLEDSVRHCIWVGTEGNLFQYFPESGKYLTIEMVHDNSVKSLALDGSGQLLAGTDNGLYVYNEDAELQHIQHDSRNTHSLSNNIIWNIFTDARQNVWVGTDYGISLSRFNHTFRYVPIEQITGTGEGNHFHSIYKDSKGDLWFGGTNGLIYAGSPDGKSFHVWYKMGKKENSLPHNRIRHIFEDKENQLWIATDGSINRFDRANKKFIPYNIVDSTGVFNSNWSYNLYEDNNGRLWVATCLGGIFVVDKHKLMNSPGQKHIADYHFSTRNGLSGIFINQLIADSEGNVWALLYNNVVHKINPVTMEVSVVDYHALIGDKNVSYMIADDTGRIWLGYRGGILHADPKNGTLQSIDLGGTYTNTEVLAMADVLDHIWISTTDGVWVVDKQTMDTRRLKLMNRPFSCIFYDKDNRKVYMGTVDGYATVSPEVVEMQPDNHSILITRLHINNRQVNPAGVYGDKGIRYIRELSLEHDENNLYIEISDLPYTSEEQNKFVYKLDGLDQNWQSMLPGANSITYSNLDYGKYQLHISKLDEKGIPMPTNETLLAFHIHPPWYHTTWARIIWFVLLAGFVAWMINFFRVRNNLRIERIEKERIMEQSKSKIDFFTNISHDLKTPLSMIIAPVSNLLLEVRNNQQKHTLEVVQRNAMKLNSLIHQVLDLNRMDSNSSSSLILSRVEFISFVRHILSTYEEEAAKEKNMRFSFHTNCEKLYMDIDLIKFESVISNLLSNAFKYTPAGGSVGLTVNHIREENRLEITVSDTGMGIPGKDIPQIFQRFFQSPATSGKKEGTGIGLYLVKTYTELHGGNVQVESEENKGTSICITLPVSSEEELFSVQTQETTDETADNDAPLILVVEDNPEVAEFICHILSPDYRCITASDGKTGLDITMNEMPELIITDLMMPVMNGLEMCRQLKKHLPTSTIPVILLTAKDDMDTELESIQLKIDAFIPKPFQPAILLSRIEQLLSSKKQMEAKARMETIAAPKAIDAVSQDEKMLSGIIAIIEDRLSDPDLNVNALSDASGINTKQLYRKVKQLTGMTPVEYIKSIRMKKAAMLLEQKKFTIAEVMYMVGFSNHSYFSKCFQKEFGKTPREYMGDNG